MARRTRQEAEAERAQDLATSNYHVLRTLLGKQVMGLDTCSSNMVKLVLGGQRIVCVRAIELDGRPVLDIREQTTGTMRVARETIATGSGQELLLADPPQRQDDCPNCGTLRTETTVGGRGRLYCPTCQVCESPQVDAIMRKWSATERYRASLPNRRAAGAQLVAVYKHRAVFYAENGLRVEGKALILTRKGATHILVRQGRLPWARFGERPT